MVAAVQPGISRATIPRWAVPFLYPAIPPVTSPQPVAVVLAAPTPFPNCASSVWIEHAVYPRVGGGTVSG